MSRGKKAKRKIGGRRKAEAAVVAATMQLADAEGTAVVPINKSRPLDLSKHTNTLENTVRSSSCNTEEINKIVAAKKSEKNPNLCCLQGSSDGEIKTSSFTILFKSDELQTLRSVLQKTDLSRTPLLLGAIILGKVDVVKRLLRDGYPINSRSEEDKTTALMWAVRNKDLEMINLLVRHGADLTLLDENEDNVALIAVQSSSWEQNDFLDFWSSIDRKIDLKHANTRGCTILHYAKKRRWNVLTDLIGKDPKNLRRNASIVPNSSCFCCYCSTSTSSSMRYKLKEVQPREDLESTLNHLTVLFEEIVNRYREIWARDRELGYPGFRGCHDGDSATTIEDLTSLRREEIARLNTILPKLEESYLQKLGDCWSSVIVKMRQVAAKNFRKFEGYVTSIQIQLLTHEVCPRTVENVDLSSADDKSVNPSLANDATISQSLTQIHDESCHENFDHPAKLTLNYS